MSNNMTAPEMVGKVTTEERDEIQLLFNRRNALSELAMVLNDTSRTKGEVDENLYEKLLKDMGETSAKFQGWWDRMGHKYQWKSAPNGQWQINFATGEILLIVP